MKKPCKTLLQICIVCARPISAQFEPMIHLLDAEYKTDMEFTT